MILLTRLFTIIILACVSIDGESLSNFNLIQAGTSSDRDQAATTQTRKDKRNAADQLLAEANQLDKQGPAVAEQMIVKARQALGLWRELGVQSRQAEALHLLGNAHGYLNRNDQAMTFYRQALSIRQRINDRPGQGATLGEMGWISLLQSRNDKALDYLGQALAIFRSIKDRSKEGNTLNDLGNVYYRMSRYDQALGRYEKALAIRREVGNRAGESSTLMNIANVHYSRSRYEKALDYYSRSLAISRELKDRAGEADPLNNLGNVYFRLSQYEKALENYSQTLVIHRELKNRSSEGSALNNMGEALEQLGRYDQALEEYRQALSIRREIKDRYGEAITLNNLGEVNRRLGNYDKALEYYRQALSIRREIRDRIGEGDTLNNIGRGYRASKQSEESIRSHQQALSIAREIGDRLGEAAALNDLMLVCRDGKKTRLAIFYGKQSVNLYQEIRGDIKTLEKESQQSFIRSREDTYRNLADLLIGESRLPEAEQVLGLLKQEEYFEFIRRDASSAPRAGSTALTSEEAVIQKRYREISDKIAGIGAERGTLLDKKTRTSTEEQRLVKLEADLVVAGQVFQKFLAQLEAELSNSSETTAKVFYLRESQGLMEDLREMGHGAVALHTLVTDEKYRVILTTPDIQKGFEYPIKAADLNRKILQYRQVLQNPKLDPLPLARDLYKILVEPVAADLKAANAQTLMWSLDGALRYLPMAALNDGEKYLVENYRITVFTPASQARLKDIPGEHWRALGLGVTKSHGERTPALPGVLQEMNSIIREDAARKDTPAGTGILPGTIRLDEEFTQTSMLDGLRQRPSLVHIASHFQFQPGNETSSALLLGDGTFLSMAQIKVLPRLFGGVELLTLSACNTATGGSGATGKEVEGFGVLAQRQGAKAVIASLWPVADYSTKYLMQEFYRLREADAGLTKAEAIRNAQLKLLNGTVVVNEQSQQATRQIIQEELKPGDDKMPRFKPDPNKPYAHPYFWAPFILIGNWL